MVTETDSSRLRPLWERVAARYGTDADEVCKTVEEALSEVWQSSPSLPDQATPETPAVLRSLHEEPPTPDALVCYLVHWLLTEASPDGEIPDTDPADTLFPAPDGDTVQPGQNARY